MCISATLYNRDILYHFSLNTTQLIHTVHLAWAVVMDLDECLNPCFMANIAIVLNAQHYNDVIMSAIASQIPGATIVCSTVCSAADQWKHQSSASLAFVRGIHRWPVDSPHKGPVTQKMFTFDDVIIIPNTYQSLISETFPLVFPSGETSWPDDKSTLAKVIVWCGPLVEPMSTTIVI